MSNGWVFVFSKFTSEALLLEGLFLFSVVCIYTAMYVLRIRKYGVAGVQVPSNVVKAYLAQLVSDAEDLRNQLFGILGKGSQERLVFGSSSIEHKTQAHTAPPLPAASSAKANTPGNTDDLQQKLRELEKKMAEQASALEQILNDKMKLEEELANARKALAGQGTSAPAASGEDTGPLKSRIEQLEAQLAEYAIIEEEISNLKKLQKENKALRAQIEQMGGAQIEKVGSTPSVPSTEAKAPENKSLEPFENIVTEVEKSLQTPEAAPPAQASDAPQASGAPSSAVAATTPAPASEEKSNASLEAEFEKMIQP